MDNGHYHPTELVSDKISSMLLFNDRLALHITRPMPGWIAGQFHSHSTVVVGLYDDGGHVMVA